jgi:hypothetical protein
MVMHVRNQVKQNGFINIRLTAQSDRVIEHSVAQANELYRHLEAN